MQRDPPQEVTLTKANTSPDLTKSSSTKLPPPCSRQLHGSHLTKWSFFAPWPFHREFLINSVNYSFQNSRKDYIGKHVSLSPKTENMMPLTATSVKLCTTLKNVSALYFTSLDLC